MPTNKDFKRLARGRMQKTGESYTSARAHLLKQKPTAAIAPAAEDYAKLAGRSDAILKARTGCTWERWVKALDYAQAYTWPHREIAKYVHEEYNVPGWWAQAVTVGYERIKGLRATGQRRDGSFEASKSKAFAVPLARLYGAFHNARTRGPLAAWCGPDGSERDPRQVDADQLAGPDVGHILVHPPGSRQEPGGDSAREAAGSGNGDGGEAILGRSAGCFGGRVGAQVGQFSEGNA